MQRHFSKRRSPRRQASTLFGGPLTDALGHLSARYPYPARLNDPHLAKLKASGVGATYPKGAILFQEGEKGVCVHVVLEGRAKLCVNSAQGKTLLLGFFGPGTILGLAAAILGRAHLATAEAVTPMRILLVPRSELFREMNSDSAAARQAAALVSEANYFILNKLKVVDLSENAPQKVARCLLGLLAEVNEPREASVRPHLNQETLAQMVGLSRETVSRILSALRNRRIVDWKRSGLVISNRRALEQLADFQEGPACGESPLGSETASRLVPST